MARALIGGLLESGLAQSAVQVGEPDSAVRGALALDFGVFVTDDNRTAIEGCSLVILAVKPQQVARVLGALAPVLALARPLVLSVAAGIRTASLAQWCGGAAVVRAMPNRPALVGAGATGLYAAPGIGAAQRHLAEQVMRAVGPAVWVDTEDQLDAVTALSGSGPAYFFLLAELMAQAAVRQGLPQEAARVLAVGTLHGAGALAHASDGDLARLRAEVTSPGGTTAAALGVFAAAGLAGMVEQAMEAAAARGRELAMQFGAAGGAPGA